MEAERIHTWHVCISGFLQKRHIFHGMSRLWLELHNAVGGPRVHVTLQTWKINWRNFAREIYSRSVQFPVVKIYAFSWGAGYGFIQLANELARLGIDVVVAVLSDPVYRSRHLLLRWLAFLNLAELPIEVPTNVVRVRWFYQRQGKPWGFRVVAKNPQRTDVNPGIEIRPVPGAPLVTHTAMDSIDAFHYTSLQEAKKAA